MIPFLMMRLFYSNFNSIKVRLELDVSARNLFTAKIFQFHKGTIRTLILCFGFVVAIISIP